MKTTQVLLARRPTGMASAEDFSIQTTKLPAPGEGQLLIRVHYISLDPAMRGWMNAGTTYIPGVELGAVMRAFAAGEVVESRHPDYRAGQFVTGLLGAQTYAVSDGRGLTLIPAVGDRLSLHLGVLGMPGMTGYFGLLERGRPEAGQTVFVSGAAGIVGSTVGQIARIRGCRVVGTAGSDAKCRYLTEECGFDAAINYKTENVDEALGTHCPDGIDVFFDNVGGPLLDTALKHLARGARVVICGAISQYNEKSFYGPRNYLKIVTARGTMTGIIVFDFRDRYPEAVDDLTRWINAGQLAVREDIDEGIANFPATLTKLFTGENFGKLLLKVN